MFVWLLILLSVFGAAAFFMAGYYVRALWTIESGERMRLAKEEELSAQLRETQSKNDRLMKEARALREEIFGLESQMAAGGDSHRSANADDDDDNIKTQAMNEKTDISDLKVAVLKRRTDELEHYADEVAVLKEKLRDKDRIEKELSQAREQIKQLEELVFSAGLNIEEPPAPHTLRSRLPESAALMGTTMDECLSAVTSSGKARSMVVADEEGLLLSASGDSAYHEALSVLACSMTELGAKAHSLLPLGMPRSIGIIDQKNVLLACRLFTYGKDRLAIAALSVGGQNPGSEIERSLKKLTRVMDAHHTG